MRRHFEHRKARRGGGGGGGGGGRDWRDGGGGGGEGEGEYGDRDRDREARATTLRATPTWHTSKQVTGRLHARAAEPVVDQVIIAVHTAAGDGTTRWYALDAKAVHPKTLRECLSGHGGPPPPLLSRLGGGQEEITVGPPMPGKHHVFVAYFDDAVGATRGQTGTDGTLVARRGPFHPLDVVFTCAPPSTTRFPASSRPDQVYLFLLFSPAAHDGSCVYIACGGADEMADVHKSIIVKRMTREVADARLARLTERTILSQAMLDTGAVSLRCVDVNVMGE